MASRRKSTDPVSREQQLISLAIHAAEEKLKLGVNAPTMLVIQYTKLATTLAQLEVTKLEHEVELLRAKKSVLESGISSEDMYKAAMDAMKSYKGLK